MRLYARLIVIALTILIAAVAPHALAGTVSLAWDPVADSDLDGYRVYYGTTSGNYTQSVDVGNVTSTTLSGLNDCTTYFIGVKAYDTAGNESATYSNQISGWSRPTVTLAAPTAAEQGRALSLVITGSNFQSGATVQFSATGITVNSVVVNSCNQITANITVGNTATVGVSSVEVTNPDTVFGTGAGLFTVQLGVAPTIASTNPANSATGVAVTVDPTVTFSEPVLASTITTTNVRLLNSAGTAIAQASGSPSLSSDGLTATISPAANLAMGGTYRIQVVGGATGVKDLANRSLAATVTQSPGFTTAADTTGPVISAITETGLSTTGATIGWTTDEDSDTQVFYRRQGTTTYSSTTLVTTLVTTHSQTLSGLTPSTTYEYYARSADAAGNATQSAVGTFATTADTTGPVISAITETGLSATGVTIEWTTNEASDTQVFYRRQGVTTYSSTTLVTTLVTTHSQALSGLTPATTYEYYVRSEDAAGNATQSAVGTFATSASAFSYLRMEAEAGALVAPVRAVTGATGAFGNSYIDTPSGTPGGSASSPSGTATYGVNIPTAGTWYLWVLMYGIDSNSDSWFESVNGAGRQAIFANPTGVWTWEAGRSYTLPVGLSSIELGGRNALARVDRILLTNDATFVPSETPSGDQLPPGSVSNFAGVGGQGTVSLSWTNPNASDFTQTIIRVRTDGKFPTSPVDGTAVTVENGAPGSSDTFNHTGLTQGATYHYSAFSVDSSGNVGLRATVQVVAADASMPAPVNNLRRTDKR